MIIGAKLFKRFQFNFKPLLSCIILTFLISFRIIGIKLKLIVKVKQNFFGKKEKIEIISLREVIEVNMNTKRLKVMIFSDINKPKNNFSEYLIADGFRKKLKIIIKTLIMQSGFIRSIKILKEFIAIVRQTAANNKPVIILHCFEIRTSVDNKIRIINFIFGLFMLAY